MKKFLFVLVAFAAVSASAAYKRGSGWLDFVPDKYTDTNWVTHHGATEANLLADGWTNCTPQEVADHQAAQAAADAVSQSNAAYQASLPIPYPTGVEVPWVVFLDATNREKGVALELMTNGEQVIYEFHASPVDWANVNSNRTAALLKMAERYQARTNVAAKARAAKSDASNAGGLGELKLVVSNLAEQVRALSEEAR